MVDLQGNNSVHSKNDSAALTPSSAGNGVSTAPGVSGNVSSVKSPFGTTTPPIDAGLFGTAAPPIGPTVKSLGESGLQQPLLQSDVPFNALSTQQSEAMRHDYLSAMASSTFLDIKPDTRLLIRQYMASHSVLRHTAIQEEIRRNSRYAPGKFGMHPDEPLSSDMDTDDNSDSDLSGASRPEKAYTGVLGPLLRLLPVPVQEQVAQHGPRVRQTLISWLVGMTRT